MTYKTEVFRSAGEADPGVTTPCGFRRFFCPSTDRLWSGEPPEVSPGPSSRLLIPTARSKTVGKVIIAHLSQKSTKKFDKIRKKYILPLDNR